VFTSTKCKVIKEDIEKVIARGFRNEDELYVRKKNLGKNKRHSFSSFNFIVKEDGPHCWV